MAKYLEKALVCEVTDNTSKDGKFRNVAVRLYELGMFRPVLVEVKIKEEDLAKWRTLEGRWISDVKLEEYNRVGTSNNGKPYNFTDYAFKSFIPPGAAVQPVPKAA